MLLQSRGEDIRALNLISCDLVCIIYSVTVCILLLMVGIKKTLPTPLFHEFTSIIHIIDNATPPLPLLPTL